MNPGNFFAELKRRHVYRVAVGYAAVAWLVIQIATQTLPVFDTPSWVIRLIVIALVAGFPVALVLSWAFELTPEGLVRADEATFDSSIRSRHRRKIDFAIIAVLALAVAALLFDRFRSSNRRDVPDVSPRSIAVLPFQNLSEEKENAFFADGIQDDLLTSLARIRDLKVISRTSVMSYRDPGARNLREIGQALRVANIIEGSVRRRENRVRVTVQLLDARDDRHIWAETYDRTISDALSLQGELATEIAAALRATLSPEEKATVARKPTDNPDAYVLYLRARQLELNPDTLLQDYKAAVQLYKEAINLDRRFALAHARLAATSARIYHFYEPTEDWKRLTNTEAGEALLLEPNLGEGHFILGLFFYWMERDYTRALQELRVAEQLLPNDTEIGSIVAAIARRQGRWKDALANFQRIETIDPQNPNIVRNLMYIYVAMRRWPEAAQAAGRLKALAPDSFTARSQAAYMEYFWKGNTSALESFAAAPASDDPDGAATAVRWDLCMIKRDFAGADAALSASPLTELSYLLGGPIPKSYFAGCVALARGDQTAAAAAFEAARPSLEQVMGEAPESAERHANLGLLYAMMGRKEAAIAEGRRAVELKPEAKDAVDGPLMNGYLALIYTRVGEPELALPLIERLLRTPGAADSAQYSVSLQDLRHRWEWDPLRGDARFQKILAGPEPATGNQ